MKRATQWTAFGLLATLGAAAIAPSAAQADGLQSDKNMWRNGAILGGIAVLYGLQNHDRVTTVLGIAGAAFAGGQYEQDRKEQAARGPYWNYGQSYYYNNGRHDDRPTYRVDEGRYDDNGRRYYGNNDGYRRAW